MTLDDIDFGALYREHLQQHRLAPKTAEAWDSRAAEYAASHRGAAGRSSYVDDFLALLDLRGARSVLDVGCGPGTLALPLAVRLDAVWALDYSPRMLQQLQQQAQARGVQNVHTVQRAWEDDWADVPVCDVAIASRSTTVDDLEAALLKLQAHARLRVALTYPVGGGFVDPELLRLVGGGVPPVPDHLLLLGLLHRMGQVPTVALIHTPSRLAGCDSFESFLQRLQWSTGELDSAARARVRSWFEADPVRALAGGAPMRWAFVQWDVQGPASPRCTDLRPAV